MTTSIYTIGHSNHPLDHFIGLLHRNVIEEVADTRSSPYSAYSPQFNREPLAASLSCANVAYSFMGIELGGRPPEDDFYDERGYVLYGRLAETNRFRSGLERVLQAAMKRRVALLCSEEDPNECHRKLLVARALAACGVSILHIRGDGRIEPQDAGQGEQLNLFGEEELEWKSLRSASPRKPQPASSKR